MVIRLSSLGDIILSFPLLKKLKEKFPEAEIHFLTKTNYEEIISLNPNIDKKIYLTAGLSGLRKQIKGGDYDLILDIHKNLRSVFVSYSNSAKIRRYKKENFKKLLLVKFKLNLFKQIIPVYKKYLLTLAEYLEEKDYNFSVTNLHFDRNKNISEKYIVISPSSRHFTKTYPKEKFVDYINKLNEVDTNGSNELSSPAEEKEPHKVRIVLIGDASEKDRSICDYIEKNCNNILNLCGKLNIKELLNVLYNCEYVICNDSAILHLSEAVGKKVIALFGSTVKEFGFFPQLSDSKVFENNNLNCRPCTHIGRESCPLGHFRCMNETQLTVSS